MLDPELPVRSLDLSPLLLIDEPGPQKQITQIGDGDLACNPRDRHIRESHARKVKGKRGKGKAEFAFRDKARARTSPLRSTERLLGVPTGTMTPCRYWSDGPTPESIRNAAAATGLPVDRITPVQVLDPYFYR